MPQPDFSEIWIGVILVAVEEGCIAADFADGVAHACEEFGVFVDEVTGAVATADLLVRQDEQQHVAGGRETLRVGAQAGGDHHGDAALHVQCAAAPDATVGDGAAEGRMRPVLADGGDDVDVAVEQERRRLTCAGQTRQQVEAGVVPGQYLKVDVLLRQQAGDVVHAVGLVAGRVGGIETQELLQQFGGAFVYGGHAGSLFTLAIFSVQ